MKNLKLLLVFLSILLMQTTTSCTADELPEKKEVNLGGDDKVKDEKVKG
jgi:hypothetical protein